MSRDTVSGTHSSLTSVVVKRQSQISRMAPSSQCWHYLPEKPWSKAQLNQTSCYSISILAWHLMYFQLFPWSAVCTCFFPNFSYFLSSDFVSVDPISSFSTLCSSQIYRWSNSDCRNINRKEIYFLIFEVNLVWFSHQTVAYFVAFAVLRKKKNTLTRSSIQPFVKHFYSLDRFFSF